MSLILAKFIFAILFKALFFGGFYILQKRFNKAIANMSGWLFVKPGLLHWFVLIGCLLWAFLMVYVLSAFASEGNSNCECKTPEQHRDDIYAVTGMLIFAGCGVISYALLLVRIYRQRLGFRGHQLVYLDKNGETSIVSFKDVSELLTKWGYLSGIVLKNGHKLYIDEYNKGFDEFIAALFKHNDHIRNIFDPDQELTPEN
jgi:hypothetical protein